MLTRVARFLIIGMVFVGSLFALRISCRAQHVETDNSDLIIACYQLDDDLVSTLLAKSLPVNQRFGKTDWDIFGGVVSTPSLGDQRFTSPIGHESKIELMTRPKPK